MSNSISILKPSALVFAVMALQPVCSAAGEPVLELPKFATYSP